MKAQFRSIRIPCLMYTLSGDQSVQYGHDINHSSVYFAQFSCITAVSIQPIRPISSKNASARIGLLLLGITLFLQLRVVFVAGSGTGNVIAVPILVVSLYTVDMSMQKFAVGLTKRH